MSAKVEKFVESRIQLKQWEKVAEFVVWGGVSLVVCVCKMTKEIAAGPDNLIFMHRVLSIFWRWLVGACV